MMVLGMIIKAERQHRFSRLYMLTFLIIASYYASWAVLYSIDVNTKMPNQSVLQRRIKTTALKSSVIAPIVPIEFEPDFSIPPIIDGMVPVITNVKTSQNVIFLGIDDGAFKDPSVIDIMKQNHIKASLYLSRFFIASNPSFFDALVLQGSVIEDHTLSHHTAMVTEMSYAEQKAEICGMADYELDNYGHRPLFFRPPGGAYSDTMRRAAADCGMKAIVTWIAKANGGSMQYQIGNKLRPGDVVLMHFRPEFKQDMQAFVDAINASGLHTELLEDAL
jgi:peptidoglycan-N-acetylglucosamine deacetylase